MLRSSPSVRVAAMLFAAACGSDVQVLEQGGGGAEEGGSTSSVQGGAGQGAAGQGGAGNGSSTGGSSHAGGSSQNGGSGQGGSGEGGAAQICAAQGGCGDCVAQACPDIWCDCVNNTDCLPLFGCFAQCPGGPNHQACAQDCGARYPDGISAVMLAANCAAGPCEASCPQAGEPINPCEECMYSTCPGAMNLCLSNSDCLALWGCLSDCAINDLSCHQGCYNWWPEGVEPLEDVLDCSEGPCEDVCN